MDGLCLEQDIDRPGQSTVIAVTDASNRWLDTGRPKRAVYSTDRNQDPRSGWWTCPMPFAGRRSRTACSDASRTNPAWADVLTRQTAIRQAQASMTKGEGLPATGPRARPERGEASPGRHAGEVVVHRARTAGATMNAPRACLAPTRGTVGSPRRADTAPSCPARSYGAACREGCPEGACLSSAWPRCSGRQRSPRARAAAVDPPVPSENAADLGAQGSIPPDPRRPSARIDPFRQMIEAGGRGDRQHLCKIGATRCQRGSNRRRRHWQLRTTRIDERHRRFDRRSGSAIARHALALRRISLAFRRSRLSRSGAIVCPFK